VGGGSAGQEGAAGSAGGEGGEGAVGPASSPRVAKPSHAKHPVIKPGCGTCRGAAFIASSALGEGWTGLLSANPKRKGQLIQVVFAAVCAKIGVAASCFCCQFLIPKDDPDFMLLSFDEVLSDLEHYSPKAGVGNLAQIAVIMASGIIPHLIFGVPTTSLQKILVRAPTNYIGSVLPTVSVLPLVAELIQATRHKVHLKSRYIFANARAEIRAVLEERGELGDDVLGHLADIDTACSWDTAAGPTPLAALAGGGGGSPAGGGAIEERSAVGAASPTGESGASGDEGGGGPPDSTQLGAYGPRPGYPDSVGATPPPVPSAPGGLSQEGTQVVPETPCPPAVPACRLAMVRGELLVSCFPLEFPVFFL
jgi:hypothetical protein